MLEGIEIKTRTWATYGKNNSIRTNGKTAKMPRLYYIRKDVIYTKG
jgi:hypothetical protein